MRAAQSDSGTAARVSPGVENSFRCPVVGRDGLLHLHCRSISEDGTALGRSNKTIAREGTSASHDPRFGYCRRTSFSQCSARVRDNDARLLARFMFNAVARTSE